MISGNQLSSGKHTLEWRKKGEAPLYASAELTAFTLEDHIAAAGVDLSVRRNYHKLTRRPQSNPGQNLNEDSADEWDRQDLKEGEAVKSGDLLEVELTIEGRNDCEYVFLKDMKPAGCEPVLQQSGFSDEAPDVYQEWHDDHAAFFMRELRHGTHILKYQMRAETPGLFHALPAVITAMYAPELKGNSEERAIRISE